jgi:UDP-N-acetylglucosamine 2-epimerase (non-hydrolysing)
VTAEAIVVTGNTVIDALLMIKEMIDHDAGLRQRCAGEFSFLDPAKKLILVTGHRRENFGEGIRQICEAIKALAGRYPDHHFVYPVHLNPNVKLHVDRLLGGLSNVRLIPPQGYRNFVALMARCRLILTDSGGVQEEAPSLGKPVLVMRDTTERPEGVEAGTALLTGPCADSIVEHTVRLLDDSAAYRTMANAVNPYGDGHAAERIVERLRRYLGSAGSVSQAGSSNHESPTTKAEP